MALSGYNPNTSLLPPGGGAIQPMSGGSLGSPPPHFNAGASLLPNTNGNISSYSGGGFLNEPIKIIDSGAKKPTVAPTTPSIPTTTEIKPETNDKNSKSKEILLFGNPITLENPRKMTTDNFTETQTKALALFGLDGEGLSVKEKRDVLQALYDGKCNSDKPLIMLQNCEPIRRIVQSLALNLLSKLKPVSDTDLTNIKNEDQPVVEFQKLGDNSVKVCLTFKPNQLSILSKYAPKQTSKVIKPPKPNNGHEEPDVPQIPKVNNENDWNKARELAASNPLNQENAPKPNNENEEEPDVPQIPNNGHEESDVPQIPKVNNENNWNKARELAASNPLNQENAPKPNNGHEEPDVPQIPKVNNENDWNKARELAASNPLEKSKQNNNSTKLRTNLNTLKRLRNEKLKKFVLGNGKTPNMTGYTRSQRTENNKKISDLEKQIATLSQPIVTGGYKKNKPIKKRQVVQRTFKKSALKRKRVTMKKRK